MASSAGSSSSSNTTSRRTWDSADSKQQQPHLPQHGNYRGYYSIRRDGGEERDSRQQSIFTWLDSRVDTKMLKRVLDVGCNSGHFTLQMCEALKGRSEEVFGVDIDRELVLLAGSTTRRTSTFAKIEGHGRVLGSGRVGRGQAIAAGPRKRLRLDEEPAQPLVAHFLQSNWVYNDDTMRNRGKTCPESMMRMQWNDMAEVSKQDEKGYNLILAMSVTKWVHINHYDTGLRRFFARVATCLAPGGIFIMEPQAYKSYKHTLKVTPPDSQPRKNFYALRVMPDDFAWIITVELGLEGPFCIREKGKDASVRQIDAFVQPPKDRISRHCLERRAALLAIPERTDPLAHLDDTIPWVPRSRQ